MPIRVTIIGREGSTWDIPAEMIEKPTSQNVTFAIPTNGRPESLALCVRSIRENVGTGVKIIVVDSTPNDTDKRIKKDYRKIDRDNDNLSMICFDASISPGHARKLLVNSSSTPYIFFMDDDHEITSGSFEKMCSGMHEYNLDIVSGTWIDSITARPAGFVYRESYYANNVFVEKIPIMRSESMIGKTMLLDDVLATMLCKMKIFEEVQFDERFDFFYELFDFFMQCKSAQLRVGVTIDARFLHSPTPYRSVSKRQTQNKNDDRDRFIEKWGKVPVLHNLP